MCQRLALQDLFSFFKYNVQPQLSISCLIMNCEFSFSASVKPTRPKLRCSINAETLRVFASFDRSFAFYSCAMWFLNKESNDKLIIQTRSHKLSASTCAKGLRVLGMTLKGHWVSEKEMEHFPRLLSQRSEECVSSLPTDFSFLSTELISTKLNKHRFFRSNTTCWSEQAIVLRSPQKSHLTSSPLTI